MSSNEVRVSAHPGAYSNNKFPFFSRPNRIGEYTVDRSRKVTLGRNDAKYLYENAVGSKGMHFDLNEGFATFEQKSGEDEKLDVLLEWIMKQAPEGGEVKKVLHEADIVCWRGLLTRIAATPFSPRDPWRFVAIRKKDVIFLCEQKTEEAIRRNAAMTDKDKMMTYWGFKFEQYITIDTPQSTPNTSQPVTCREEFATVVRSTLAAPNGPPLRILYSGEVDAIDRNGDPVEMKTQRHALEGGFWRQKSLKWWLQSFLVGIENIIVGFRDDQGIVNKVDSVRVDALPRSGQWDAAIAISVLSATLSSLRQMLRDNDTSCVVEFTKDNIVLRPIPLNEADFLTSQFRRHFCLDEGNCDI